MNVHRLIQHAPLHYPSARANVWMYCVYLGPFTVVNDGEETHYDLGIRLHHDLGPSLTFVQSDTEGDYQSYPMSDYIRSGHGHMFQTILDEIIKRALSIHVIEQEAIDSIKLQVENEKARLDSLMQVFSEYRTNWVDITDAPDMLVDPPSDPNPPFEMAP